MAIQPVLSEHSRARQTELVVERLKLGSRRPRPNSAEPGHCGKADSESRYPPPSAIAHAALNTGQLGESCDVCQGPDDEFSVSKVHAH
jgi:hypothetical protein